MTISVDHFECNPRGRLPHTYGKEREDDKYKGGCIFVDHSSGYIQIELQTHLNTNETLDRKKRFQQACTAHGIVPQSYLSDGGSSFTSAGYTSHLSQFGQTIRHAPPGGHHSNGIAKRNIGTIMSISRAMLHHQAIHSPSVANVDTWSLAIKYAVYILNRIPHPTTGRSPLELFSRQTWPAAKLQDFHVWGCPAYVLNSTLASGGRSIPDTYAQLKTNRSIEDSVFVDNHKLEKHTCKTF